MEHKIEISLPDRSQIIFTQGVSQDGKDPVECGDICVENQMS